MWNWLTKRPFCPLKKSQEARTSGYEGTTRVCQAGNYRVEIDLTTQVLRLECPPWQGPDGDTNLFPSVADLNLSYCTMKSSAVLRQKAKQFNDGLYAAVELAAQNGAGEFRGKAWLLKTLLDQVGQTPPEASAIAANFLHASAQLGQLGLQPHPDRQAAVQMAVEEFLADTLRSKPISFYTWSEQLRNVFLQDRFLQQELANPTTVSILAGALEASGARRTYQSYLDFVSLLTNPHVKPDLLTVLDPAVGDAGHDIVGDARFFPPSRAHETQLIKRLYPDTAIPDGFDLADELIRQVRTGELDLRPVSNSGWYDIQSWALEPLIRFESMGLGGRVLASDSYREYLCAVLKNSLALTRETHIKNLEIPLVGSPRFSIPKPSPPTIKIRPELTIEPHYSVYLRSAISYGFVREVLEEFFGNSALKSMSRLTPDGPADKDLDTELRDVSALFYGASVGVSRELGFSDEDRAQLELSETSSVPYLRERGRHEVGSGSGPDHDEQAFHAWVQNAQRDPDVGRDTRMMVPVFFDIGRRKIKAWVFLGWAIDHVSVFFDKKPSVSILDRKGRSVSANVRFKFEPMESQLICPVVKEVYVTHLLDRDEFCSHCDRYKTPERILAHLE